jgi:hypothetical protein
MRHSSVASESVDERGVYWAKYLIKGRRVALAVDRCGNVVRSLVMRPEWVEEAVIAYLWRKLEELDPVPRIALVRDATRPAPPVKPVLDPYADDQQYRRQLVRAGARKLRFFRD